MLSIPFAKMSFVTYLISLSLFVNLSIAGYVLKDDYSPSVFFDMFDFFTSADPTNGFVDYVDQSTAAKDGYIINSTSTVYIGTDHSNVTPNGRPSVRLTSKNSYNSGSLVILDLAHMPGGICGTWPAFWMVGPDWPAGGEIDIIEGVNLQTTNAMTLHSSDGCSITNNDNFTGYISTDDCYIYAEDQSTNAGCSIDTYNTESYGTGFNNIGGGVYAMEWTDAAITIWFFPRGSIPSDITSGNPKPSGWGEAMSQFQGCCDIPEYFTDNQIVFDLTYCGDWAGDVWSSSSCASKASTCDSYVENNPTAFASAYWLINSLKVYTQSATTTTAVKVASSSTSSKKTTSTKKSTTSTKKTSSSTKTSTSTKKTSTSTKKTSTSTKKTSTSTKKTSTSTKKTSTSTKKTSTSTTKATTSTKKTSTSTKATSTSTKKTSTSTKSASTLEKIVSTSSKKTSTSTNKSSSSTKKTSTSTTKASTSTKNTSTSTKKASTSTKNTSTSTKKTTTSTKPSTSTTTSSTKKTTSTKATSTPLTTSTSTKKTTTSTTKKASTSTVKATSIVKTTATVKAVTTVQTTATVNTVAEARSLAKAWSSSEPANWNSDIASVESAAEAAASEKAAVESKLSQNSKRSQPRNRRRGHN